MSAPVSPLHPVEPVREHLRALMRGMRLADVAERTGIPMATINGILYTRAGWVLEHNARAILALDVPPAVVDVRYLDSTGTRRRLRALCRIGWTQAIIADRLGVTEEAVSQLLRRTLVTRTKADEVKALYRELAGRIGPSQSAMIRAANRGWHSPAAWDEVTIDDPDALPLVDGEPAEAAPEYDELTVQLAVAQVFTYAQLDRHDLLETIRRLAAAGVEDGQIAERLRWPGRNPGNTVCKIRERAGIPAGRPVGTAA